MNTHQDYLDQFDQFCNSVLVKQTPKAVSPRGVEDLIASLEGMTDRLKLMEREMVDKANRVLRSLPDDSEIDYEILKNDLVETAKSYMMRGAATI